MIYILPEQEVGHLLEYRVDASDVPIEARDTWDELTSYRRARTVRRTAWMPIRRIQFMDGQDDADVERTPLDSPKEQSPPAPVGPPGWPAGVPEPQSPDFGERAVAFLLDHVLPGYRAHAQLFARYPLALATMALHHLTHERDALKAGYRSVSYELKGWLEPHRGGRPSTGDRGSRASDLGPVGGGGMTFLLDSPWSGGPVGELSAKT